MIRGKLLSVQVVSVVLLLATCVEVTILFNDFLCFLECDSKFFKILQVEMKEQDQSDGVKFVKNIVYINGINDNGAPAVFPISEVDKPTTTTIPNSGENKIYNYIVYEGRKGDLSKAPAIITEKTEPIGEIPIPVSFIFFNTIQKGNFEFVEDQLWTY